MKNELSSNVASSIKENIKHLCSEKEPIQTEIKPDLKKLKGIKAVYFDVYGTILISGTEPGIRNNRERQIELLNVSLKEFGVDVKEDAAEEGIALLHKGIEAYHAKKREEGIDYPEVDIILIWENVITELIKKGLISSLEIEKVPEFLTDFVIRYDDPWLMPGLNETIEGLHETGKKTGIISNSSFYTPYTLEALAEKDLSEMGFKEPDCFWSFAEDIAKPSVQFYEIAKAHLKSAYNIEAEEMLFVGNDMLNDVYPANKAGFKTALFAGDLRSLRLREGDSRVENLTPDITITELTQILECIF